MPVHLLIGKIVRLPPIIGHMLILFVQFLSLFNRIFYLGGSSHGSLPPSLSIWVFYLCFCLFVQFHVLYLKPNEV